MSVKAYSILFIAAVVLILGGKYQTYLDKKVEKAVKTMPDNVVIKNHGKILNDILTKPIEEEVKKEKEEEVPKEKKHKSKKEKSDPEDGNDWGIIWDDMTEYTRGNFLGNGTFGDAYRCYKDNETFVLKHNKRAIDTSTASKIRRELRMYKALKDGPNIAKFITAVRDPNNKTDTGYILESVNMTKPYEMIERMTKEDIEYYWYHMLVGLEYMHSKGIIHGDIKTHNVAIDMDKRIVRILDLGTARYHDPSNDSPFRSGTVTYRPPEVLMGSVDFSTQIDVWAMGCIFANMLFNTKSHYKGKDNMFALMETIAKEVGTSRLTRMVDKYGLQFPFNETLPHYKPIDYKTYINKKNKDRVTDDAIDLLKQMLTADPARRITAKKALQHRLFKKMRRHARKNDISHVLYTPTKVVSDILKPGYDKPAGVN